MAVAQFFGIMPVSGVRCKSVNSLKFKKFSIRFIWSVALIVGLLWLFAIDIIWIYRSHVEFGKVIGTTFDITNLVSLFCFMELATKWPEVMLKWNEVEKFLPKLKYQMEKQVTVVEVSKNLLLMQIFFTRKWLTKSKWFHSLSCLFQWVIKFCD